MSKLSDLELFSFFLDKIELFEFIKKGDRKEKIRDLLNELREKENELNNSTEELRYIPIAQQEKIKNTKKLWELLLKEAIYCLRVNDEEDENEFKQDFGLIETKKYFDEFSNFEEVLYGSVRYYRDHSLHVLRVFLTGCFILLDISNSIDFNSIEIFGETKSKEIKITMEEKQAIWTIIALTHDLGYPIEKIDEINQKIKGIIKYYGSSGIEEFKYHLPLQNQNLNDFILKFISSKLVIIENSSKIGDLDKNVRFYTGIQNKYYLKFAKAFEKFSHGIMSCILLMKHLVYFKESDYTHSILNGFSSIRDAKQFLIRNSILRSIASHDNDDIYHIYPNNFLFLLTFCDEMQEWDRPYIEIRFKQSDKINIKKFENDNISYIKKYYVDKRGLGIKILENFSRSIKKYIKLFRSGPDSEFRPFNFEFILNIYNEDFSKDLIKFRYPPNKKPEAKDLIHNDECIDKILEFIESEYKEELEGITQLIGRINESLDN
jgi:hypothetical protein